MDPDDWRPRVRELACGDTLEAMLRWAATREGWTVGVSWLRTSRAYRASVYRAKPRLSVEREHPTDPTAALAWALLDAVAAGGDR